MLLTIYNLPENTRYLDVKSLIETQCGIKEMILDNLVGWGAFKKVTLGLASEEDAAILVRKINGLYINGTQLHVEDVRKKKAMEQPYYSSARNETHWNQHQDQSAYMGQSNEPKLQSNMAACANLLAYCSPSFTQHVPSGSAAQPTTLFATIGVHLEVASYKSARVADLSNRRKTEPHVVQPVEMLATRVAEILNDMMNATNVYPTAGLAAVRYPSPQRTYETSNQPHQEPLGFRSEGNATTWSRNQGRNHEPPKNSFPQRDSRRWSPERGQRNERSQRPSRRGGEDSDRGGGRRHSPPRDRRPNYERNEPSTSRSAFDGDHFRRNDNRSPPRTVNFTTKTNRGSNAPAFGKARDIERASFNNPNKPKAKGKEHRWPETNIHQPWSNPGSNAGSFKTRNRVQQSNMPANKRSLQQNIQEPPQKMMRRPSPILKQLKQPIIKPKYTAEEYAKLEELRGHTWRAQTASRIAKDMLNGKAISDVDHAIFFKELKRVIRDRLTGMCHPLMRHEGMYVKYRKKFHLEEDEALFQEVMESSRILEAELKGAKGVRVAQLKPQAEESVEVQDVIPDTETTRAQENDIKVDIKVLNEAKPLDIGVGTFKIPMVPKLKPAAPMANKVPKYTKGELFKFKREKQQNKILYQRENMILRRLDPKIADALETEATLMTEKFLEECEDIDPDNKVVMEHMSSAMKNIVADHFKWVVKVQMARRILNTEEPLVHVLCSPKILKRDPLMRFLKSQGVTAIKKLSKQPLLIASCTSYRAHDRLCTAEPFAVHDHLISFKPQPIAGPPVKFTKGKTYHQRKLVIDDQINDFTTDIDDDEMKLMNDMQQLQENLEGGSILESLVEETHKEFKAENVSAAEAVLSNNLSESHKPNIKSIDSIKREDKSQNAGITNVKIEDFTNDVHEMVAQKDVSADDYKIVEDTIGNFNNNEGTEDLSQDGGNIDDGDEQYGVNMDDGNEQDSGNMDVIDEGGKDIVEEHLLHMDDIDGENGGNIDGVDEDDDEQHGEDIDDGNCEDLELGDIDENDLEDY